jgi:hypothetical protein
MGSAERGPHANRDDCSFVIDERVVLNEKVLMWSIVVGSKEPRPQLAAPSNVNA